MTGYEIDSAIEKIIENHCEYIPYEGTEVNKIGMKEDLVDFIRISAKEIHEWADKTLEGQWT